MRMFQLIPCAWPEPPWQKCWSSPLLKQLLKLLFSLYRAVFIDSFSKISQQLLSWCGCVTGVGSCTLRAKTSSASPLQVPLWGGVMFTGSSECRVRAGLVSFLEEVCDVHCGRADKREVCQAGTAPVHSNASVVKTSHCFCHPNPLGFCSLPLLPSSSWRS